MRRKPDGSFAELRWTEALNETGKIISQAKGDEIVGIIGPHADAESIVAFRDLLHRLGSDRIHSTAISPKIGVNIRSDYLFNSKIIGLDHTDYILLVGTNLRSEAPILNSRIMRHVENKGIQVDVLGVSPDLNFVYDHIGTSPATLEQILNGSHSSAERLRKAKFPMIVVSSKALERSDGEAIMNNVKKIAKEFKVVNAETKWNGLNVLQNYASTVAACDIGIPQYEKGDLKDAKVVYILGHDDF
jgi:NADH dehydrogenase/NADH:ubiquinone oxidoreductase subunit G